MIEYGNVQQDYGTELCSRISYHTATRLYSYQGRLITTVGRAVETKPAFLFPVVSLFA